MSRSFFDRIERPVLAAWQAHLAAEQRDINLRHRAAKHAWRRWIHRQRWQRQIARSRWYRLTSFALFIVACIALVIVAVKTA